MTEQEVLERFPCQRDPAFKLRSCAVCKQFSAKTVRLCLPRLRAAFTASEAALKLAREGIAYYAHRDPFPGQRAMAALTAIDALLSDPAKKASGALALPDPSRGDPE